MSIRFKTVVRQPIAYGLGCTIIEETHALAKHRLFDVPAISPNQLKLILVRHGEAGGDPLPDDRGSPLTTLGKRQAKRLASRLTDETIDHIYTSDLARARETAQAVSAIHEKVPVHIMPELREVQYLHCGTQPLPRSSAARLKLTEERQRVEEFRNTLARRHQNGELVLVVCHGNLIRFLIALYAGLNPRNRLFFHVNNASVSTLILPSNEKGMCQLLLANCVSHLLPNQVS